MNEKNEAVKTPSLQETHLLPGWFWISEAKFLQSDVLPLCFEMSEPFCPLFI